MKLGFENDGELATDILPEQTTVPEAEFDTTAALNDMQEMTSDIDDHAQAVTDVQEAAETVSDIKDTMQASVDSGEGLSETSAEIAEVAVEAMFAKLGLKTQQKPIPALESFGNKHSRVSATKIAIESLGENIKKMFNAVIDAFLRIWEKIKEFIKNFFMNTPHLRKRLEACKKKLEGAKDYVEPKENIHTSAAKAFSIKGEASFETVKVIFDDAGKMSVAIYELSKKTNAMDFSLKSLFGTNIGSLSAKFLDYIKYTQDIFKSLSPVEERVYGHFVNSHSIELKIEDGKPSISMVRSESPVAEDAKPLSQAQMRQLLEATDKILKDMDQIKKDYSYFDHSAQEFNKIKIQLKTKSGDSNSDPDFDVLVVMMNQVKFMNQLLVTLFSKFPMTMYRTVDASITYVNDSLKNTAPIAA